jgi:hypothetical protein
MELNDYELGLCFAALENAVTELKEGQAASIRLKVDLPGNVEKTIREMVDLKNKIAGSVLSNASG